MNAARIGNDGSSGGVETTIPHPESNSRKPASSIPNPPEEIAPRAESQAKAAGVARPIDFFYRS
jgi:hypothetical protein